MSEHVQMYRADSQTSATWHEIFSARKSLSRNIFVTTIFSVGLTIAKAVLPIPVWVVSTILTFCGGYLLNKIRSCFDRIQRAAGITNESYQNGVIDFPRKFLIPANPERLSNEALLAINSTVFAGENEERYVSPVKYSKCKGGLGVELDCTQLTGEQIGRYLHYLSIRYPQICRITISNMQSDGTNVITEPCRLAKLTQLVFRNCPNLTDEKLNVILESLPNLRGIDVPDCNLVTEGYLSRLQNFSITYPNHTSNRGVIARKLSYEIARVFQRSTKAVVELGLSKHRTNFTQLQARAEKLHLLCVSLSGTATADVIDRLLGEVQMNRNRKVNKELLLDAQRESTLCAQQVAETESNLRRIEELNVELEQYIRDMEPSANDGVVRHHHGMLSHISQLHAILNSGDNNIECFRGISDLLDQLNNFPLVDEPLQLDLSNTLVNDRVCAELFHELTKHGIEVSRLNLSGSIVTGECLSAAMALNVEMLELTSATHLQPEHLELLKGFQQLQYLDLTNSLHCPCSMTDNGPRSIADLVLLHASKLKWLILDGCSGFTLGNINKSIADGLPQLEGLSLVGTTVFDVNSRRECVAKRSDEHILEFLENAEHYRSRPFCVKTERDGNKRIDLIAYIRIDERCEQFLNYLRVTNGSVKIVYFGKNSRLSRSTLESISGALNGQIEEMGFHAECKTERIVAEQLHQQPLKRMLFTTKDQKTTTMQIEAAVAEAPDKITIVGNITELLFQYLMKFKKISEINFSRCFNLHQFAMDELKRATKLERCYSDGKIVSLLPVSADDGGAAAAAPA